MRAQQQAQQTRASIAQQEQVQPQPQPQQAVAPQTAASHTLVCARDSVIISGLQSQVELNGARGIVESYTANGRWQVRLEGVGAPTRVAIRPDNLTVVRGDASAAKATAVVAARPPATEHAKAAAASETSEQAWAAVKCRVSNHERQHAILRGEPTSPTLVSPFLFSGSSAACIKGSLTRIGPF